MRKPRVLVTYLEAGMGHIVSAKAISEALKKQYGNKLNIIDLYISKDNKILQRYEKNLIEDVKNASKNPAHSNFQFFCMDFFGREATLHLAHNTVFARATKEMQKVFAKYRPDVIVSTHFSPHYAAIELRNNYLNKTIVATYDPDPNVHGWWDNRSDLFFVNNNHAKQQAIKDSKFNPLTVREVNCTARECIVNSNLSKAEYREKYNLPKDNFTIILSDGAYASAKLKEFTNEFLKIKKPVTLIVIAGKNEKIKEYFDKKQEKLPKNITMKVFGFVDNIHELYCASDIFVTKAGPNAIQDSLFMKTPVLVNYYASPIEKFTQKLFVKEYHCGETILDKVKARRKIEKWIADPTLLKPYIENCNILDKTKNGADEIATQIYEALKYYKPELF
jgi:processive 1,2-diacylglycerol beta-glucosyltransferase